MTDLNAISFEEKIQMAVQMPRPRPEFLSSLRTQLAAQPVTLPSKNHSLRWMIRRPLWLTSVMGLVLVAMLFIVGPQKVWAAVRGLLGYIPGVGIVDQSAPIRVLAEPVSVTQDGITMTVSSATLTRDRTTLDYRIFGVPGSSYPGREDVIGCAQSEYLRLGDGTRLARMNDSFPPVPAEINEAVFVVPCIFNTLPGTVPENWELPLRFVPAPPDLTVIPVVELSPSPQATLTLPDENGSETLNTPATTPESALMVTEEIETSDGYILLGEFHPLAQSGSGVQQIGSLEIRDASGKKVNYTYPPDIPTDQDHWAVQFPAAGLVYPLTISLSTIEVYPAESADSTQLIFDAGPSPQPGQEWIFDQEFQLAGYPLKLISIGARSNTGYSFQFKTDPQVEGLNVQIAGYTPTGSGGGTGPVKGEFNVSLHYEQIPTGVLTVVLSDLLISSDPVLWQGQWSPATPRSDLPDVPTPQPGVCLTPDSVSQLPPAPAELSQGTALVYEQINTTGPWGLVLYNLDGSQQQVVTTAGNWGALSPDGAQAAYSGLSNEIHVVDLATQTDKVLPGPGGFNLRWSPDGQHIAYIGSGNGTINSVWTISTNGSLPRQIAEWSYATIIGWSPDGTILFFAVPFTGGSAWNVYAFDGEAGITQELFTIENGTPKFLNPQLSPDGEWIAYRGRDNSSVYLVRPDGSDMHLLVENAGAAAMAWSRSGWLGVTLRPAQAEQPANVLLRPATCETYLLPSALDGDLQGLYMP